MSADRINPLLECGIVLMQHGLWRVCTQLPIAIGTKFSIGCVNRTTEF
jgi:hypothetical protein